MEGTGPALTPNILVAPLDWGLGHATRCVPLIRSLLNHQCQVWLAGEGPIRHLLQEEFGELPFLHLPSYNIRYAKNSWSLPFVIMQQLPRLLTTIQKEQQWLQNVQQIHHFDAVISDNRYGLHHPSLASVFITHQLQVQSGLGGWTDAPLRKGHYRFINRFSECWVPDAEGDQNLAGRLSHPAELPRIPTHYLGPLSRLRQTGEKEEDFILVVLSGPEPQRSILEEALLPQLEAVAQPVVVLRGLPGESSVPPASPHVRMHNHLPAVELERLMAKASIVISRSGYSTVMDLAALQKKSILVPTPGQTEQACLAQHLSQQGFACTYPQAGFSLPKALQETRTFSFKPWPRFEQEELDRKIARFVKRIAAKSTTTFEPLS